MDLGISGKKALVCASSVGLGYGCAKALAQAGVELVICARNEERLSKAATNLRKYGVEVTPFPCDITSENGQKSIIEYAGVVDILINNAGGPPPGIWMDWDNDDFKRAINANMLTPINLIKAFLPKMIEKSWGRIINITSSAVKSPIPILGLSNSARAGLTGYVAGVSRQIANTGVTINNLLPGVHDTDRILQLDEAVCADQKIKLEEARKNRSNSIPVGRYGTIDEFGNVCAFLCSVHSGFIIGQNILLDGGATNSTL